MSKIKFAAKVTKGNIEIPQEYRESIELSKFKKSITRNPKRKN
jgi:hypothetical protein